MKSTNAGYINKNNQKNLGYKGISETHYNQKFFEMECLDCGHKYMANGCDVWLRKCPRCIDNKLSGAMSMNKNSENPRIGKDFQIAVKNWFEEQFETSFKMEHKILIGNPAKLHSFDISDIKEHIVVECKCYTWTETGNVPSAKMGTLNEAAFYLSFLPKNTDKYIVMSRAKHEKRKETLAEYYFRTYRHLLGDIKVFEYDMYTGEMFCVGENDFTEKI